MTPTTALAPRPIDAEGDLDIDRRVARLSREFGQRIVALVGSATITVTDATSCEDAVALRSTIGALKTEIEGSFEESKAYYNRKHREVCAEEHKLLDQLIDPKNSRNPNTIDGKLCLAIQAWTAAEDRRRQEEEARRAEQLRKDDEARAAAEAAAAEQTGDRVLAAAILEEAISAPTRTVVLPNVRTEVRGLKTKRFWRWRFTGGPNKVKDILKETPPAVLAKAMTLLPRAYCAPDVRLIDDYVDAMKDKASIPGIQVYYDDVPVR
jgi:hypothetical protein